jgi:hypothetical protein
MFLDHEMLRQAATEAMCNMVPHPALMQYLKKEEDNDYEEEEEEEEEDDNGGEVVGGEGGEVPKSDPLLLPPWGQGRTSQVMDAKFCITSTAVGEAARHLGRVVCKSHCCCWVGEQT